MGARGEVFRPPSPPGDPEGTRQNKFVFKPSLVYQQFNPPFDDGEINKIAEFVAAQAKVATAASSTSRQPMKRASQVLAPPAVEGKYN